MRRPQMRPPWGECVSSLARPGGNVTGLSLMFPELVVKWLELLKQAVPEASRIALLWQPGVVGERTWLCENALNYLIRAV